MPELPEVETVVRELRPIIKGKTFESVTIHWPRTVAANPDRFAFLLEKNTITDVHRRGKYICIALETGDCITIHLRMTGNLVFKPEEKDMKYIRTSFFFTNGSALHFVDIRKFGRIELWSGSEPLLPKLGPEPLDQRTVLRALTSKKSVRAIKTFILDQHILAGVGNIYADEALFMSGIHPATPAINVPFTRLKQLSYHIPLILLKAIENHGTTISDYRRTEGNTGNNQFFLNVYGRTKTPCPVCDTPIRRLVVNARSSHYCPKCQRKRNKKQVSKGRRQ